MADTTISPQSNFLWESTARHSSFSVNFPKTPSTELLLIGAELFQEIDSHDILVLEFKGKPFLDSTIVVSGDPVEFVYTSGPNSSKFNGYVYTLEPSSGTEAHSTTVTCVSASYLLKNTDQRVYKNTTADGVVSKVAAKHGMQAVTQRHPRIRESIVQAGQSDWQLLRRLAKQAGFALRAENTTLTFVSKDKIYNEKKPSAPYFKYEDGLSIHNRMYGTCFYFEPEISDDNPDLGARVNRVITGTSTITSTPISTTHAAKDYSIPNLGSLSPSEDFFTYGE